MEVLQRPHLAPYPIRLPRHVEPPLVVRTATQQQCPGPSDRDLQVMPLQSIRPPHRRRTDLNNPIRRDVSVSPPQDHADEITSMVVEVPPIIGPHPMVQPDRESKEDQSPSDQIGTLQPPQLLSPAHLEQPKSPVWFHSIGRPGQDLNLQPPPCPERGGALPIELPADVIQNVSQRHRWFDRVHPALGPQLIDYFCCSIWARTLIISIRILPVFSCDDELILVQ